MRRAMVAGNWKMHGTRASVCDLVSALLAQDLPESVDVALFPTSLFIAQVVQGLVGTSVGVGGQDCAIQPQQGALTGEIAAAQLVDAGCSLVLVGHSERRILLGESDRVVAQKFAAAQSVGLVPVLCVGETLKQRDAGETMQVVARQLDEVIRVSGIQAIAKAVVAYEPVWAIGTGLTATAAQAQEIHAYIRSLVADKYGKEVADNTSILYGGSCNPGNAAELFANPDVDGGLIGGASLKVADFKAIIDAF